MRLSTVRRSMLLIGFCTSMIASCGSYRSTDSRQTTLPAATPSTLPFSTIEPKIYQADVVVSTGDAEEHTFVARKDDKHRIDIMRNGEKMITEIVAGPRYVLDHRQHTYYEIPLGQSPSGAVSPAESFFRGKGFSTFEEIGRDAGAVRYRVKQEGLRDQVVLTIDTKTNLIIAQEFTADDGSVTVKYELRDLKLDVDDSAFQVPAEYRKVPAPSGS